MHAIIRRSKNERKKVEGWMRWTYPSSASRSFFISLFPVSLLPSFESRFCTLLPSPPFESCVSREGMSVAESPLGYGSLICRAILFSPAYALPFVSSFASRSYFFDLVLPRGSGAPLLRQRLRELARNGIPFGIAKCSDTGLSNFKTEDIIFQELLILFLVSCTMRY